MKFSKDTLIIKEFPTNDGSITIQEYDALTKKTDFSIDGALSIFNGSCGFKTNNFEELLFVIEGKLKIIEDDKEYEIEKDEMTIIKKGVKHNIEGYNTKAFIVCNPPFNNSTSYEELAKNK